MTIARFDPFRLLTDVYLRDEDLTSRGSWLPPVDIFETAGRDLVIKVELPDVNREDVEVTVENNTLTLRGEKKMPADVKEEQFRRIERSYGMFVRSFQLPSNVDADKASAQLTDGVLTLRLPKKDVVKGRKIEVNASH